MIAEAVNAFVTLKDSATPDIPGVDRELVRGVWASEAQEVLSAAIPVILDLIAQDMRDLIKDMDIGGREKALGGLLVERVLTWQGL